MRGLGQRAHARNLSWPIVVLTGTGADGSAGGNGALHLALSAIKHCAPRDATEPLQQVATYVRRRESEVSRLQRQVAREKKRRLRWQVACGSARREVAMLKTKGLLLGQHGSDSICRLSVFGGFSLALQRCATGISARRLGISMQMDVHHGTVSKWESWCWSSLVAAMRAFHHEQSAEGRSEESEEVWLSVGMHGFRCDATNASVWQRSKLQSRPWEQKRVPEPPSAR